VAARILVVDDDPNVQRVLTHSLRHEGYEVVQAADGAEAMRLWSTERPSLVLLDASLPKMDGYQVTGRIRAEEGQASHVPVIILAAEADLEHKVRGLRAGADDFLVKPFQSAELLARVKSLLARYAPRELETGPATSGRVLAFYGAKGGVGATSLAINTAVALQRSVGRSTVLVDADLQFGDHRVYLDLGKDKRGLVEALAESPLDAETLRQSILRHGSGVSLLLAPATPEAAELVTPQGLTAVLHQLQTLFEHIVVDCHGRLDETTLQVFDLADTIFLVMNPELSSLKNTTLVLDMARDLGYARDKIQLVLNRAGGGSTVNVRHAESVLKQRIQYELPNDFRTANAALTRGDPLVVDSPDAALARAIVDLARSIDRSGPARAAEPEQAPVPATGKRAAVKSA
jgi:pilus assembly protein CpaE